MPENTLLDFLGPLASGFWPENALDFDILAICGGSRSILSSNYLYIFRFHGGTGNNKTIHIPKEHLARIFWTSILRIVAR